MNKSVLACMYLATAAVIVATVVYSVTTIRNSNDLHSMRSSLGNLQPELANSNAGSDAPSDIILGHTRAYWRREYPEAGVTDEMTDREATNRVSKAIQQDAERRMRDIMDSSSSQSPQLPTGQGQ